MKALFGGIIVDGSGGVGGYIITRNRYGSYVRVKPPPPPPNVPAFVPIRNQAELIAKHWSTLSELQRQAWTDESRLHPKSDSWGKLHSLPGYNYYMSVNMNRWFCAVGITDNPPGYIPPGYITDLSLTYDSGADKLTVSWLPALDSDVYIKLWANAPVSYGLKNPGQKLKCLGAFPGDTAISKEFYSQYYSRFAVAPTGGKVFAKVSLVHSLSGIEGLSLQALATII